MIGELKARKNVPVKLWIPAHEVESSALDQLKNVADLPNVFSHVAAMPDVHAGAGATIGTVFAMEGAIIPAAVGVDIGCGMEAVRTNLQIKKLRTKRLEEIRDTILEKVPVGVGMNHKELRRDLRHDPVWDGFENLHKEVQGLLSMAQSQLGTLGGGNHFIELSIGSDGAVWVMLHTGSRGIGNKIAIQHIRAAKSLEHNQTGLPDKALSSFLEGTPEFNSYVHDLGWAQRYAARNRSYMLELVLDAISDVFSSLQHEEPISCHHNFAQQETHYGKDVWIIRKGAIEAREDQWGIVPGAMGAKSYIVQGKGDPDSFNSAPHGAGRKMSRSQAKKRFGYDDLKKSMGTIVNNATRSTVDEIMHSYKDIDTVIEYASDLVTPVHELEQLLNIKG